MAIWLESFQRIKFRELLKDEENVKFAGYRKPHPLENKIELKIQTTSKIHPKDALRKSTETLKTELDVVLRSFEFSLKEFRENKLRH